MCGLVAVLQHGDPHCAARVVSAMRDEVAHRGPDDEGLVLVDRSGDELRNEADATGWQVALGFRRLSILDLTTAGRQPMGSPRGYRVVFNGEVYNYVELRTELETQGHRFRSGSDTEVVLAAYAEWGVNCFERFRGMWGLVILDPARRMLVLSRDRLGIKPLYFWQDSNRVAVVSEVKQLMKLPGFRPILDDGAGTEFLRTGYEVPTRTFFKDVDPVPPGHYIEVPLDGGRPGPAVPFWHPELIQPELDDPVEAANRFAAGLRDSVRLHRRSDVPVGCALSGGLDSSSIVALCAEDAANAHRLHTFTATFPGETIDEAGHAAVVARATAAEAQFVRPDPMELLRDLDHFVWIHDEPVSNLSIYASYCVARAAREAGVPVLLNGQGGDELLGGYWQSYLMYLRHLARERRMWSLIGHVGGSLLPSGNAQLLLQVPRMVRRFLVRRSGLVARGRDDESRVDLLREVLALSEAERRIHEIRHMFLPRLLKWDDRNSMAFAVEGRYPYLDHKLIDLCLSFAPSVLYDRGWTKVPLRRGLKPVLPASISGRRTKLGFETPQEKWVRGPLRPTLERWVRSDRPLWQFVPQNEAQAALESAWRLGSSRRPEPTQSAVIMFMFDQWLARFSVAA
jgi:asparagine synthase (glutamine-hydrolysing)